jgi:hypothetical protein
MPLSSGPEVAAALAVIAEAKRAAAPSVAAVGPAGRVGPAGPLPQVRPAAEEGLAPTLPLRPLWTWWVVVACALVVIVAVVLASMYVGRNPGAKAAPAAGAKAQ